MAKDISEMFSGKPTEDCKRPWEQLLEKRETAAKKTRIKLAFDGR